MKRFLSIFGVLSLLLSLLAVTLVDVPAVSAQTITVYPAQGSVGTQVTLTGSGFVASTTFNVNVGGSIVTSGTTPSTAGAAFSIVFIIPSSVLPGSNLVVLTAGTQIVSTTITILQGAISLSSVQGAPGSAVNVSGNNFGPGLTITFSFDNVTLTTTAIASNTGTFTARITVPEGPAGSHSLTAQDSSGNVSTAVTFTTVAAIDTTAPDTASNPNTLLTINGKGFAASDRVSVYLGSIKLVGTVPSNASGSIVNGQTRVGEIPAGVYQIKLTDSAGNTVTASTTFTFTSTMKVDDTNVWVGKSVTVSGTGFAASADIRVTYDGTTLTLASPIRTQATGLFSGTFTVPTSVHGPHTVVVTDGTNSQTVTLAMESTAPPIPVPSAPASGARKGSLFASETPTFTWASVTDPSGVTYSFQLAQGDQTFSLPKLSKENLTVTSVSLAPTEALSRGTYFWRVRATDGAGNVSEWYTPSLLYIGSSIPDWIWIVFMVMAAIILFLVIRIVSRSMIPRV